MRRLFTIRPLLDEGQLLRSTERTPTDLRPYATGGSAARRGNQRFTSEPLFGGEESEAYLTELDMSTNSKGPLSNKLTSSRRGTAKEFSEAENGEKLISLTHEERKRALEDAGLVVPEFDESRPVPMMWFSPDGENWTVFDAEQTFGTDHPPTEVVIGSESVLVKWSGLELTGYEEDETTGELEDPPDLIWVAKLVGAP